MFYRYTIRGKAVSGNQTINFIFTHASENRLKKEQIEEFAKELTGDQKTTIQETEWSIDAEEPKTQTLLEYKKATSELKNAG